MTSINHEKEKLLEQYDAFAEKFKDFYLAGKERGQEAMSQAMEKAQHELTDIGKLSAEQGEFMKAYLARDLDHIISDTKDLGHTISDEAKEKLKPSRLRAGALSSLAFVLEQTTNALHALKDKTVDAISYRTGEITSAGSLTCQSCGFKMHLKKTGHIPPCPKCSATAFHKGY